MNMGSPRWSTELARSHDPEVMPAVSTYIRNRCMQLA